MTMAGRGLPALTRRWMQAHSSAKALKLALLKCASLKAMGAPRLMLGKSGLVGMGGALSLLFKPRCTRFSTKSRRVDPSSAALALR